MRSPSVLGAVLALVVALAPSVGLAQDAPFDAAGYAAEQAAQAAAFSAPLSLADFAGQWWRHGFYLDVKPDGSGQFIWRTYDDTPANPKGKATVTFDHVTGRTAYGTVSGSTDPKQLPNGPITVTEYDYGLGELVNANGLRVPEDARTGMDRTPMCGPRYSSAPSWFTRLSPCGA